MNWSTFMLNEFLDDCLKSPEKGTPFHYTWLFIYIALVRWKELEGSQFFNINRNPFMEVRYEKLWFTRIIAKI